MPITNGIGGLPDGTRFLCAARGVLLNRKSDIQFLYSMLEMGGESA